SGQEDRRLQDLTRLTEKEKDLAKQLAQARGGQGRDDPWVELAEVRQALPADGVLIDLVRFPVRNFQAKGKEDKWQAARYVAWIMPPQGQATVQIIDLGAADK